MPSRLDKYREQGRRDGRQWGDATTWVPQLRQALADALKVGAEEAMRQTVAVYRQRLDAIPSSRYPELRGMRDCIECYNAGVADVVGCGDEAVMLRANYLFMMTDALRFGVPTPTTPPGCTLIYFPVSDRGPLVANNNDGLAAQSHCIPPPWIEGNQAGLIVGTVSSGLFGDEPSPEQFPAPVFLMVQEMCTTVDEAVELLTRLNHFWGPCNLLLADRQGNAAVIEKSSCRFGVRLTQSGFAATTEMAAEETNFKAYLWATRERALTERQLDRDSADWAYWKACERRSNRLQTLLTEAQQAPTFAALESMIYDHCGEPEQIHMDGSRCHPEQSEGEWSLRTSIWVMTEKSAQYSFAEPPLSGHLTPRHWRRFDDFQPVF